jgi:hypothetical protein
VVVADLSSFVSISCHCHIPEQILLTTLFVSKSQHFTILSSPHENMYGCLDDTASPRTVEICPVSVSFNWPDARSQILMVRSPAPEANHWLFGSTASARTQPRCPLMTRCSFHGACQSGRGCANILSGRRLSDMFCGSLRFWVLPPAAVLVPVGLFRDKTRAPELAPPAAPLPAGIPSINLRACSSDLDGASSPALGFFLRGPAAGSFLAMTSGSVWTSLYSAWMRRERADLVMSGSSDARPGSSFMRLRADESGFVLAKMVLVLRALSRMRASRRETSGPSAVCAAMAECTSAISRECG